MSTLDSRIRKIASKVKCEPSKEYEERINSIIKRIKNENKICPILQRPIFRASYATIIIMIAFVMSITTAAASDYVEERMLKLDENEQKKYQETAETTVPDTEAVTYSRPFNVKEQQRYDELLIAYEGKGLFPKSELLIVEDFENTAKQSLVYENRTRTLHLPKRSLTDEELLQIIDFYHKADYSLQQSNAAKETKEKQMELENALPGNEAISKEQATELAAYYLKAMFDVNSSNIEVDYGETEISEGDGDYLCSYVDGEYTYNVALQSYTAKLISIDMCIADVDFYAEPATIDEEVFISKAKEVKELFYNIYGEETKIASITCSYKKDENNNVPYGNVLYYIEFEDGTAARFSYNVNYNVFWQMILFPNYRDMRDAEEQGIREIEQDRVYIELE